MAREHRYRLVFVLVLSVCMGNLRLRLSLGRNGGRRKSSERRNLRDLHPPLRRPRGRHLGRLRNGRKDQRPLPLRPLAQRRESRIVRGGS